MQEVSGKEIADKIRNKIIASKVPQKFLAGILVGDNQASKSFINQKQKFAESCGINFQLLSFPETISEKDLEKEILNISQNNNCGGIIIQLPLPEKFNTQRLLNIIPEEKDPDALSESYYGKLILSPAIETTKEILSSVNFNIVGKNIAVIGYGQLVGKPISKWLKEQNVNFKVFQKGDDLSEIKLADLIILGTGNPRLIKGEILKSGVGIIDFGYGYENGKIIGDLDPDSDLSNLSFYTPTPGGTGPILVAKLFENFCKLC